MAASVGRATRDRTATVRKQIADAIDRPLRLEVFPLQTTCRSRENTPAGTGAPFQCLVVAMDPDKVERFVLDVPVTAIEGRCWRGVNVAVKGPDGRWLDYDKANRRAGACARATTRLRLKAERPPPRSRPGAERQPDDARPST